MTTETTASPPGRHGKAQRRRSALKLPAFLMVSFAAGGVGNLLGDLGDTSWYDKPSFMPPGWIFGPVWAVLYTLMGVAAWRISQAPRRQVRAWALLLFFVQLGLNAVWPGIFAGLRAPGWALAELILLAGVLVVTVVLFFKVDRLAGLLLLPYLGWVGFAIVLNAAVWRSLA
jgi:tryptophan-rich sensory protein